MAKRKSFDPDALAKAGQEIAKKHQSRENVTPPQEEEPSPPKRKKESEKTQLCRVGISFHRRVKFEAVKNDMTIRQFLEKLIDENTPEI